jgi:hypothetical protein
MGLGHGDDDFAAIIEAIEPAGGARLWALDRGCSHTRLQPRMHTNSAPPKPQNPSCCDMDPGRK